MIEKHFENRRKPEDNKRLKEQSRQRKNARLAKPPRQHDWLDTTDDVAPLEQMSRKDNQESRQIKRSPDTPATREADNSTTVRGCVLCLGRGRAEVNLPGGIVDAELSPDLAMVQQSALAVGDIVRVQGVDNHPRVVHVEARRSSLSRPDPGNAHRRRLLAANIDVAVLVLAARRPAFKPGLVDRFLVALGEEGVAPLVVANKIDLVSAAERASIRDAFQPYAALDVPTLLLSAESGEGLGDLGRHLQGKRSVFVGHSGVGKSSLLNALDPHGERQTRAGREGDGKGRHTTTHSTLTILPNSTEVIDTPGVRAFGLWDMDREALRHAFPDFAECASACRYRDCSHLVEPECGVRQGVDSGLIAASRFASYARIHASLETS